MGASQSSEEEPLKGLWYKPSPNDSVSYIENVKQRMANHVNIEERLEKIAILRTHHAGSMVSTGEGQPRYYIFLESSNNFWTLDQGSTFIFIQKGQTAEEVIKKVAGEERLGRITKIKEADAAGTLGALFDWMEDSGEFNQTRRLDRWGFANRVFSKFENGNVQDAPWFIFIQKGQTAEEVIKKVAGKERFGCITKIKEADASGTLGALFDWLENSGEFNQTRRLDRWGFANRVFSKFENGNVQDAPWYLKLF